MATLTVFYSILFFFLRAQTKRLRTTGHKTDDLRTTDMQWEVSTSDDVEAPNLARVMVTKSVLVSTEEQRAAQQKTQPTHRRMNKVSVTLLIYPLLYMILTMPICIARIAEFVGRDLGLPFTYSGAALFECTGFVNVLLYTSTRKGLVSWNHLKFWKKRERTSQRQVINLESPLERFRSKASSIAPLKGESVQSAGPDSDEDSQLES
jgi:hypothetical protein